MNPKKNGENIDIDTPKQTKPENGGITDKPGLPATSVKMGSSIPPLDGETELKEEARFLARNVAELAVDAMIAIKVKGEMSSKDVDMLIASWVKIAGVETKLGGDADSIDRIMGELTAGDGNPDD